MRCFTDITTKRKFEKALRKGMETIFVRSAEWRLEPDTTLATLVELHEDVFVVGPEKNWFARVESNPGGRAELFTGNILKAGRRKRRKPQRR